MKKNAILILLIFLVPIAVYWWMTRDTMPASIAADGDVIIKFASPMCYECQELDKIFDEVFPKYNKDITLRKIDVTKRNNQVNALIKEHDVKLVPTTVFKNQDGKVIRKVEGSIQPEVLESYLKELING